MCFNDASHAVKMQKFKTVKISGIVLLMSHFQASHLLETSACCHFLFSWAEDFDLL